MLLACRALVRVMPAYPSRLTQNNRHGSRTMNVPVRPRFIQCTIYRSRAADACPHAFIVANYHGWEMSFVSVRWRRDSVGIYWLMYYRDPQL